MKRIIPLTSIGTAIVAAVLCCLFSAGVVGAVEMRGRLTSDLYVYKVDGKSHWRPYLGLRSDIIAWRGKRARQLSFHSNLRWKNDLSNALPDDPQLYVYTAYARLSGMVKNTRLALGRQFVYNGAGSVLLDGFRTDYRNRHGMRGDIFVGSVATSSDPEIVRSFGDYGTAGGRFSLRGPSGIRAGSSMMWRRIDGATAYLRSALDLARSFDQADLYGRLAYNLTARRPAEMLLRVTHRPGPWYLSGEINWREPSVSANTVFSMLDYSSHIQFRTDVRRELRPGLSAVGQLQNDFFAGEDARRLVLGLRTAAYSVAWHFQGGVAGNNNGIRGTYNRRFSDRWDGFVVANLFRYNVQPEQDGKSDSYATTAGIQWRNGKGLIVRAEGQLLRNAIRKNDTRLLLRVSRDFSLSQKKGRGGR